MQTVLDGHNDVLLRLWQRERDGFDPVKDFVEGVKEGHIDGPRARAGGLGGGLCAIYIPSGGISLKEPDENGRYEMPLPEPLERLPSLEIAVQMASIAVRLDRVGAWRLCRNVSDIEASIAEGRFAAVLHMEGCEAIDADLEALDLFHAAGLRSLGPVWSRTNVFGHGVPFAFPASPDSGPGLTEAGKNLVRACNRLGIMVDLSHITEKGFWDVAAISEKPLVATHSNVHALSPSSRNLTDRQLDAIRESGGVVGLNFAVVFLRKDGREDPQTPLSDMVRHVDHLVAKLGIDGVALGSDFDGALIPGGIGDAAGLQNLVAALESAGYAKADIEKICLRNWLRVLGETWN